MQEGNYKKGFKFDHVWDIMKDFKKFKDHVSTARDKSRMRKMNYASSESNNPAPDSPVPESPSLSSFSLNLDDTNISGSSSKCPIDIKKKPS